MRRRSPTLLLLMGLMLSVLTVTGCPRRFGGSIQTSCEDYCVHVGECVEPVIGPAWDYDMCVTDCVADHVPGTNECHDAGRAFHACYLGLSCNEALMPLAMTSCGGVYQDAAALCGY